MKISINKFSNLHRIIILIFSFLVVFYTQFANAQGSEISAPWVSDLGNGKYKNPVIFADYSDPDAIRVGDDYYMVSSSFSHFPGLPILHSKDLVNWSIIGHAVENYPFPEFEKPQHGNAIWAPSLRFHKGKYHVYFCDPDRGAFMTRATDPAGPWEPLRHIKKVTGWIDCCPHWDDDGSAYLAHAYANSRSGIKSLIFLTKMNKEGTEAYGDSQLIFNGQKDHITMEGPKLYKRNGYYYVFAPAGGVKPGWQTVLRSKNIYGPYEDKVTLEQGSTKINGPHQGAWVTTTTGEDWFIHFQDRYAYGRLVQLQPMRWENDWPVMGVDYDKNGVGEPVTGYTKPNVGKVYPVTVPQTSDEFDRSDLGLQWQWQSNFKKNWYSLKENKGYLRLYSEHYTNQDKNLWSIGRLLLQKLPAPEFSAITKVNLSAVNVGEKAGLLMFGADYAYIAIEKNKDAYLISQVVCKDAIDGENEKRTGRVKVDKSEVTFKVEVHLTNEGEIIPEVMANFSYSLDGEKFKSLGKPFIVREGRWVGAKVGLFSISPENSDSGGYADFNWFRVSKD